MLNRLRANPWLRVGFVVLVAGACTYGLVAEWSQAHAAMTRMNWYPVIGAGIAAVAGSGCMLLAWRALLADMGSPLSKRAATRVMSVAQLGKYLPGAVWAFAAQIELARDYEVPRRRCATTVITSVAVTLGMGLALAALTLSLTSSAAAVHYWWALALAPVILIGLYPPVLGRVIDRVMALLRKPPMPRWPTGRGIVRAAAWTTAGWLLWGVQAWLLLRDVTGRGPGILLLSVGAYALAWCAGTMIVIFPGGIGPRELALIAALAPIAPRGPALVVAVLSRVLMTASDLLWASAGLLIGKLMASSIQARHAAIQAAAEPVAYTVPSYGSPPPGAVVPPPPAAQRPRTDLGCAPAPDPLPD